MLKNFGSTHLELIAKYFKSENDFWDWRLKGYMSSLFGFLLLRQWSSTKVLLVCIVMFTFYCIIHWLRYEGGKVIAVNLYLSLSW